MSMAASGAFGGTLVFGTWKGRPVVRQLVTPANPQSTDQQAARNAVRVLGVGQHFCSATSMLRDAETETDKVLLTAAAPSGQAWNGFLVKEAIGASLATYEAATAAYAALTGPQKTAWDNAAGALVPPIPAVVQKGEGGVDAAAVTAGAAFYHYVYGLYAAGIIDTIPGAVPPTYA
jgi:hypothetical protein